MMKKDYSEQNGRSMIEMLGVLAIIGVLSIGGIAGYSKAMAKYRINRVIDQATMMITNIRILYTNQKGFGGLNEASAAAFDVIPMDMVVKEGENVVGLQNAMGGKVSIEVLDNGKNFRVAFGGLDKMACISVLSERWEQNASSGLLEMQVGSGGNSIDENISLNGQQFNWENKGLPISIFEAENACNDDNNAISWLYNVTSY